MLRALTLALTVFLAAACSGPKEPTIDSSKIELTAEEVEYVRTHQIVTWVVEDNRPPFVYIRNGKVLGISKDYLDIISKKTGLIFRPAVVGTMDAGISAVKDHKIDIITSIRPSEIRSEFMDFTPPYSYNAGVFIFRVNSPPGSPLKTAVCKGDAALEYLRQRFPEMTVVETADVEEAIALLEKGLIDAALMNEASADFLSEKSIIEMRKAKTDFDYPLALGYQKENELLGSILSKAINSISVQEKKAINDGWKKE